LSGTNGNGHSGWVVEESDSFAEDRAELERQHPRLHAVLEVVCRQFERLPDLNSRKLVENQEVWLYRTRWALGAPPVFIYYEVVESERLVYLLALHLAE
jgi:hypothetical protein